MMHIRGTFIEHHFIGKMNKTDGGDLTFYENTSKKKKIHTKLNVCADAGVNATQ